MVSIAIAVDNGEVDFIRKGIKSSEEMSKFAVEEDLDDIDLFLLYTRTDKGIE